MLTNVVLYVLCGYLGLERVVLNIDYILVIICWAFVSKRLASLLWCIVLISDVLLCLRQIFPFFRLQDILYISKFIWISSDYYKFYVFLLITYLCLGVYILIKSHNHKKMTVCLIFVSSFLYLSQTFYHQLNPYKKKIWIESEFVEFIALQHRDFHQSLRDQSKPLIALTKNPVATDNLRKNFDGITHSQKNVLLVVVESLGYPRDPLILEELLRPLKQNSLLEFNKITKASYVSATVDAELRELCKAQTQNFNLKDNIDGFSNCLPHEFKAKGYETTAMHGALGLMYDRKYWYPRAGFDQTIFQESKDWKTRCYSFPGVCDRELIEGISKQFNKPNPQFFYWLTLNSHAVYDSRDIYLNRFDCGKFEIPTGSESCRNLKLQAQFIYYLANLTTKKEMQNTEVIVVGDHTPAIINLTEKSRVFEDHKVLVLNFSINKI